MRPMKQISGFDVAVVTQIETGKYDPEGTPATVVDTPHGALEMVAQDEAKPGNASRPHNYHAAAPPMYGRVSEGDN